MGFWRTDLLHHAIGRAENRSPWQCRCAPTLRIRVLSHRHNTVPDLAAPRSAHANCDISQQCPPERPAPARLNGHANRKGCPQGSDHALGRNSGWAFVSHARNANHHQCPPLEFFARCGTGG